MLQNIIIPNISPSSQMQSAGITVLRMFESNGEGIPWPTVSKYTRTFGLSNLTNSAKNDAL
jgi:hypothetical protein